MIDKKFTKEEIEEKSNAFRQNAKASLNSLFLQCLKVDSANVSLSAVDEIVDSIISATILEVSLVMLEATE